MGLTIHYHLTTPLTRPGDVRDLLESIRQVARDLPFKEVGELVEFKGEEAHYDAASEEDEHRGSARMPCLVPHFTNRGPIATELGPWPKEKINNTTRADL